MPPPPCEGSPSVTPSHAPPLEPPRTRATEVRKKMVGFPPKPRGGISNLKSQKTARRSNYEQANRSYEAKKMQQMRSGEKPRSSETERPWREKDESDFRAASTDTDTWIAPTDFRVKWPRRVFLNPPRAPTRGVEASYLPITLPPLTTAATLFFLDPRGSTSIRALIDIFSSLFPCKFPVWGGVGFIIGPIFWGSGWWTSNQHGPKAQVHSILIRGGGRIAAICVSPLNSKIRPPPPPPPPFAPPPYPSCPRVSPECPTVPP